MDTDNSVRVLHQKFASLRGRIVNYFTQNGAKLTKLVEHFKYLWTANFPSVKSEDTSDFIVHCLQCFGSIHDISLLQQCVVVVDEPNLKKLFYELVRRRDHIIDAQVLPDLSSCEFLKEQVINTCFSKVSLQLRPRAMVTLRLLEDLKRKLTEYCGLPVHCIQFLGADVNSTDQGDIVLRYVLPRSLNAQFMTYCYSTLLVECADVTDYVQEIMVDEFAVFTLPLQEDTDKFVLKLNQLKDQLLATGVKPDGNNCVIAVDDIEKLFAQAIVDVKNMNPSVPSVRLALGGDQKTSETNVPHPGGHFPLPAEDVHNISTSSFDDLSGEHGIQNSSFEGLHEPELENISTDGDISAKSSPKTPTSTLTATEMSKDAKKETPKKDMDYVCFNTYGEIPKHLLDDIVRLYKESKLICRSCHFRKIGLYIAKPEDLNTWRCPKCKGQETVCFIKSSEYCNGSSQAVAILPTPKLEPDMLPYVRCSETSHEACLQKSAHSNHVFAHSVEELVIWNVELHYRCPFSQFIETFWGKVKDISEISNANFTEVKRANSKQSAASTVLYDPTQVRYPRADNVPRKLLDSIVACYKQHRYVCQQCYYERSLLSPFVHHPGSQTQVCKACQIPGKAVVVIPSSDLCLKIADWIPIPPRPTHRDPQPYEYCGKPDHDRCYRFLYEEMWFAHTVEELVIWTIERDTARPFSVFIEEYPRKPLMSLVVAKKKNSAIVPRLTKGTTGKYKPELVKFVRIREIPSELLAAVVECYKAHKIVCKICFYVHKKLTTIEGDKCSSCRRLFEPLHVVPSCPLCESYFGEYVAIPPYPRGGPSNKVFEYCQKKDHYRCFKVYYEQGFWYTHSVEEAVIWTVERELDLPFDECIPKLVKS